MMRCLHRQLGFGILAALLAGVAQAQDCYVINANGDRVRGRAITVTDAQRGDLLLQVDDRVKMPFRRGRYRFAYVPKPREVEIFEKALAAGKYDGIIKNAAAVFAKYKFIGWGDYIAYMEGMSHLKNTPADPEAALTAFRRGLPFAAKYKDELTRGFILGLLDTGRKDEATELLDKLIVSAKGEDAAFAFNARGRILEDQGKKKEAVLEYLKTLLLFEPGTANEFREEARAKAVALLKSMNDGRYQRFESMK